MSNKRVQTKVLNWFYPTNNGLQKWYKTNEWKVIERVWGGNGKMVKCESDKRQLNESWLNGSEEEMVRKY